jgi:hypothetical protein
VIRLADACGVRIVLDWPSAELLGPWIRSLGWRQVMK